MIGLWLWMIFLLAAFIGALLGVAVSMNAEYCTGIEIVMASEPVCAIEFWSSFQGILIPTSSWVSRTFLGRVIDDYCLRNWNETGPIALIKLIAV